MSDVMTEACLCGHGRDRHLGGGECGSISGPPRVEGDDRPRLLCSCSSFRWVLDEPPVPVAPPSIVGRIFGWFR